MRKTFYTKSMGFYPSLPLLFVKFWFVDAPFGILVWFASLNNAFLKLFSLSLLVRTFFWPIKNEYRQGLVGFSIGMGIVVKTMLILVDLLLFALLIICELIALILFVLLPFLTIALLFLPFFVTVI